MVDKLVELTSLMNSTKCCEIKIQFEILNYDNRLRRLLGAPSEHARRPTVLKMQAAVVAAVQTLPR